jgi:hypothetical protein
MLCGKKLLLKEMREKHAKKFKNDELKLKLT